MSDANASAYSTACATRSRSPKRIAVDLAPARMSSSRSTMAYQVSYAVGWTAWLDIAPHGVNKGTALEQVREWLGFAPADVLVIGEDVVVDGGVFRVTEDLHRRFGGTRVIDSPLAEAAIKQALK